jgi:hypothetical protein
VTTRCRSCEAPIRWARTAAGKAMPLDVEPSADGNVQLGWVGGEEIAIVLGSPADRAGAQVDGIDLFVSHFATCPNASQHRRDRSAA